MRAPPPAPGADPAPDPTRALEGLNPLQREAASSADPALVVVAGPGTGKTRVLAARAAWLVAQGAAPEQVMAITFTNRAAEEMRARLVALLGNRLAGRMALGTFHALCARILRAHAAEIGRSPRYAIYDREDQLRALRRAAAACGERGVDLGACAGLIAQAKGQLLGPADWTAFAGSARERAVGRVWEAYERELATSDALDFDGLIAETVTLLERRPDLLARQRAHRRHVLVDEYQDTDRAQLRLLGLVATDGPTLFAVGDPDQTIYGFRGCEGADGLAKRFPATRALTLQESYRSTPEILDAAAALVAGDGPPRPLLARRASGASVEARWLDSADQEARLVAERLAALAAAGRGGEAAVLYRSRMVRADLEPALAAAGVPYRVLGGVGLLGLAVVRDALAYLRVAANPADREAFARAAGAPRRGIGQGLDRLLAAADQANLTPVEAACRAEGLVDLRAPARRALVLLGRQLADLHAAAGESAPSVLLERALLLPGGLVERLRARAGAGEAEAARSLERLRDLHRAITAWERREPEPALWRWLAEAALAGDPDEPDRDGGRATLATVHAAKGLEWPVVFRVGLEEGTFPSHRAVSDGQRAEERRLAYVAVTRARDLLVASGAARRRGRLLARSPYLAGLQAASRAPRARAA